MVGLSILVMDWCFDELLLRSDEVFDEGCVLILIFFW